MLYVGLDLGQKRDHTAVAVVERIMMQRAYAQPKFERLVVRFVERMPLGMPYPQIVARVADIVWSIGECSLAVDATGVGAPVVDMLRAAKLGCRITPITITGGERASGNSVPKQDLMAEVLVLLEDGKLTIGDLKEGPQLLRELGDVRTSVNGNGRVRLGAEGGGEHDDLAIALALACWSAKKKEAPSVWGTGRLF